MRSDFDRGLTRTVVSDIHENDTGGLLNGIFIGTVMDDHDPQKRGRVWVYIDGVSSQRTDEMDRPIYGSNPPDEVTESRHDANLRNGWILVSPVFPFSGSDDYRSQRRGDGTSSLDGNINSYGMVFHPRVGDRVSVFFHAGQPSMGYYFGMVPNYGRMDQVPGVPASEPNKVKPTTDLVSENDTDAYLPSYDKAVTSDDPDRRVVLSQTDMSRNLIRSGLTKDDKRGAGSSSFTRESPSYVMGIKSPGWSFDSEKDNQDEDGKPFRSKPEFSDVNSVGHQLVFDDHPRHQSIRLRTSDGAQFLMHDGAEDPFIYIQTKTGGVWIELADSGALNIYASGSINVHAEDEVNVTADADLNMEIGGDWNVRVGGDYNLSVQGDHRNTVSENFSISYGGDRMEEIGGNFTIRCGDGFRVETPGDCDFVIEGDKRETIHGDVEMIYGSDWKVDVAADMRTIVGGNIGFTNAGRLKFWTEEGVDLGTNGDLTHKIMGDIGMDLDGEFNLKAVGNVNIDGEYVYIRSGKAKGVDNPALPDESDLEPLDMDPVVSPTFPETQPVQKPPSKTEILAGEYPDTSETVTTVVPQHQPWIGSASAMSIGGVTGDVFEAPAGDGYVPPETVGGTDYTDFIRNGTGFLTALNPLPSAGLFRDGLGQVPVFSLPEPYETDRRGEKPKYRLSRMVTENDMPPADSFGVDKKLVSYMKRVEPFYPYPKKSKVTGRWTIGYGSPVRVGMRIGNRVVTEDDMRAWEDPQNDSQKDFVITRDEAETLLIEDLEKTVTEIKDGSSSSMTPHQFRSMTGFTRNADPANLSSSDTGRSVLDSLASGDFSNITDGVLRFTHVGDGVSRPLVNRRRYEAAMFTHTRDTDGVLDQYRNYRPASTVKVSDYEIDPVVRDAICHAWKNYGSDLPDGYLFALAAQESSFNPYAKSRTSSARGLYQFTNSTGLRYGLDAGFDPNGNVWNPYENARAGAQFAMDNYRLLEKALSSPPSATELYLAHFMGIGSSKRLNGAIGFIKLMRLNPSGYPHEYVQFRSIISSNRYIFYRNGSRSSPRTFSEVYALFDEKVGVKTRMFANICNGGGGNPPPGFVPTSYGSVSSSSTMSGPGLTPWLQVTSYTPGSRVKWATGLRTPDFTNVHPGVIALVEQAASEAGINTLYFNSGYRDPAYNRSVGGAKNSQHMYGRALDLSLHSYDLATKRRFIDRLCANEVRGIGIGINTVHVDIRPTKRPVTWAYRGGNSYVADILRSYKVVGKISSSATYA